MESDTISLCIIWHITNMHLKKLSLGPEIKRKTAVITVLFLLLCTFTTYNEGLLATLQVHSLSVLHLKQMV